MIIANVMGELSDKIIGNSMYSNSLYAWIDAIAYTLQIFYDFSAYSDMAIGLGMMMGFHFKENFNYPYISSSITEFWRRWHISLSSWFRDYVYIPLGGNRKGKLRTYINLGIIFLATGIWHGAAWNYILWGIWHGCFCILERLGFLKVLSKIPKLFSWIYTSIVVIVGWVLFRIENLPQALSYIKNMFSFQQIYTEQWYIINDNKYIIVGLIAIIYSFPVVKIFSKLYEKGSNKIVFVIKDTLVFGVFLISIVFLARSGFNPFIYFKF